MTKIGETTTRAGKVFRRMPRERISNVAGPTSKDRSRNGLPDFTERTPVVETMLFALLPLEAFRLSDIPLTELVGVAIVLLTLTRAPRSKIPLSWLATLALFFMWALLSTALFASVGPVELRRLGHIGLWAALIIVVGTGRVNYAAMSRGLGLGVGIASLLGVLGVQILGGYAGRLTGLFGEPNFGGLVLVAYGLIALSRPGNPMFKAVLILVSLLALYMTFSRTSWLAILVAGAWFLVISRANYWLAIPVLSAVTWLLISIADSFRQSGPFADRAGSDVLREIIFQEESSLIQQNPLVGHGAGSARVLLGDDMFFFHNSYLALVSEFGLIGLGLVIIAVVPGFLAMVRLPKIDRNRFIEMAYIGVAICALNLGEVLLSLQAALVCGATWRWRNSRRPDAVSGSESGIL